MLGKDFGFSENIGTPENYNFAPIQNNLFNLDVAVPSGTNLGNKKIVVGDIDTDGDLDLFVAEYGGEFYYLENSGDAQNPFFEPAIINPFGLTYSYTGTFDLGDIDNDGDLDVIGNSDFTNSDLSWFYYENQGNPEQPLFNLPQEFPFDLELVNDYSSPELADIDGDGDLDLFYGDYDPSQSPQTSIINFAENKCVDLNNLGEIAFEGPFSDIYNSNCGSPYWNSHIASDFVDIDNDGDLDLFAMRDRVGEFNPNLIYKENTGTAFNPLFAEPAFLTGVSSFINGGYVATVLDFSDLDNDGDQDLIIANLSLNILYFENIGTPSEFLFDDPQVNPFNIVPVTTGYVFQALTFVDLDGDGLTDIVGGEQYGNGDFIYYKNIGTPTAPDFDAPITNPFNLSSTGEAINKAEFLDLDIDGDLDLLTGGANGAFLYFENSGTVTAPMYQAPVSDPFDLNFVTNSTPVIASGDLDNDGDIDLHIGGYDISTTRYFRNTLADGIGPAPVVGGDVTIPLDYDGVTNVAAVDLIIFDPCDPVLPFDSLTADFTIADASHIGAGPIPVEVTAITNGVTTVVQSSLRVVDLLSPEIPPIPPVMQEANPGDNFVALPDFEPIAGATDNSGDFTITQDPIIGTEVPVNTTITVIVRAADASGNETVRQAEFTATPSLGIEDNVLDEAIQLYPNPADNSIVLSNKSDEHIEKVQFLDVTGKVVREIILNNNTSETSLDISPLTSGLYMVKIVGASTSVIKKIIKK